MLIEEVKNYLNITWQDHATDNLVAGLIARGQVYLEKVAGRKLNFEINAKPKELLMEYCLYVRSYGLADFQQNYLSELLTLQMEVATDEDTDV